MNNAYKIIIAVLVCLILVAVTVLGVLLVQRNGSSTPKAPSKPGLYDANGELVASWNDLVKTYGLDVTKDSALLDFENVTLATLLETKFELGTGVNLVVGKVDRIGAYAFVGCNQLTDITLPNSVKSIGVAAFGSCTNLEKVTLSKKITLIDNNVFSGCTSLTSITIPNGVTNIGNGAFQNCSALTSVKIPDSVKGIGNDAFNGCASLTSVSIPKTVTRIGENVFKGCENLASITIPKSLTSITGNVFSGCKNLSTIMYTGTIAEWNAIEIQEDWFYSVPANGIQCSDGILNFDYSKLDLAKILSESPLINSHVSESGSSGKFTYASVNTDASIFYYHNTGEITYLYKVDTNIGLKATIHITAKYGDFEHASVTYIINGSGTTLRASADAIIDATQKTIQIASFTQFHNFGNVNREEVLEELNANITTAVNSLKGFMTNKLGLELR